MTPQLPVNAGYDLQLPVSFTVSYVISWTGVPGSHTLTIPASGTGI